MLELYVDFVTQLPVNDMSHEDILGGMLTGLYKTVTFTDNGRVEGIMVFKDAKPLIFVIGIVLKGKVAKYFDMFYKRLSNSGYTTIRAISNLPQEKFEKFSGMSKVWSTYQKEF